jgi:DNA-binding CsgD family transcriptional regulator
MVQGQHAPLDVFVGRVAELAQLAEIVARARAGVPWLVGIGGEPGTGKTSLVRRALAGVPDLKVLPARAAQAETELEFGLAGQLLRAAGDSSGPVFAAGGNGSPHSSFAVGAHLLDVVGELAANGPVAIVIDDLQWADRGSVEALTFMLRRLSVDSVIAMVIHRGDSTQLDEAAQRLLASIDNHVHIAVGGLSREEVTALAAAFARPLEEEAVQRLHGATGGHPLYLRTILSERSGFDPRAPERLVLPRSLAAAIGDQLRTLPPDTRGVLEMLSVLNTPLPLAQLAQAAEIGSPTAAIEPAVAAGLVDWATDEVSRPVGLRHLLIRDAVYASIPAVRRRVLHARAAVVVSEPASWEHRVAALEQPDEGLATELERLAAQEFTAGRVALAATRLQWASDISPDRDGRERRLLTAALYLLVAEESLGLALRPAVEAAGPSPLRESVLGVMALLSGQFAEAERRLTGALAQIRAQDDPASLLLAAWTASWLAGTNLLMGHGEKGLSLARWALDTGCLDPRAVSWTRIQIALGTLKMAGPAGALAEVAYLDPDPARVGLMDAEGLAFRGLFRLLNGELGPAVTDMRAGAAMVREGALFTLGLHPYVYLTLAQYLAGYWDDALLTSEQAFSAAAIRSRRYELPLLHLAAACVPAGRGQAEAAERHVRLAEEAAARIGAAHEGLYAAMARALVAQAAGDYLGMTDALEPFAGEGVVDGRSRQLAALWGPLLAEGLVGSGQTGRATVVLEELYTADAQTSWLQPAITWLAGWLAEQQGDTERAGQIYQRGEQAMDTQSPVYTARLLLAHGRLLRRIGQRRLAIGKLRRAHDLYLAMRAQPFLDRAEQELAACHLSVSRGPADRTVLALTSRETEVAHLVGKGLSNPEIAAELFVSRKAVEYHLSNVYAKCGLHGRQQLRRFVEQWPQAATT